MEFTILDGNKVNYNSYWDETIDNGIYWNSPFVIPRNTLQAEHENAVLATFEAEVDEELGEDKFLAAKDYFYDWMKQYYPNDIA